MKMICPRCGGNFEQRLVCPKCKVRLVLQSLGRDITLPMLRVAQPLAQVPWSRIGIGLLLAMGIFFGLKQLCLAGLLVADGEADSDIWTSRAGPALVLTLQGIGLLLGGALAGAGGRRGPSNGFIIGAASGMIFVGVFRAEVPKFGAFSYVVDLIFLALMGVLGGWLGKRIWRPIEELAAALTEKPEAYGLGKRKAGPNPFAGPISWFRVILGIIICVPPSVWSMRLLFWAVDFSHGVLTVEVQQMRLFSWILTALALMVGSMIAGSNVYNSLKQGLCVGVATLAIVLFYRVYVRGFPQVSWMAMTCGVTMGACLLGSWFGGQLLPPLAPRKRIKFGPLT
jgi:hypothetical protein